MRDFIFIADNVLEEPEEGFGLVSTYSIEGDYVLYLVRTDKDELVIDGTELIGEVIDNQYVFLQEADQDTYELIRQVGPYRVKEIFTDEYGNDIQIEKPYMFGLFA